MAKRVTKKVNNTELDGKEFFAAIAQIEQEKGIKPGYMMEKISQALLAAYRRDHEGVGDNLVVDADPETNTVRMFLKKDVVETVDDPGTEISLDEARMSLPQVQLGDVIRIEIKPKSFGRIAAQTARQVIIQGIREAEQDMVYDQFCSKEHELLTGIVTRIDPRSGAVVLRISAGGQVTDAYLGSNEQVKGEHYTEGQRLRVYVVEVRKATKGPRCPSPAPTPVWSSACSSLRCPRSTTALWRSAPLPARQAAAPSWPSGRPTPMWTPSAPASAPAASA